MVPYIVRGVSHVGAGLGLRLSAVALTTSELVWALVLVLLSQ